ncbi:methyltransferase family protein [Jatrophihabitans sp. GAS493]|uniref:class I SAM-dependent methyltransferase n=1 Tax=Jatrophihabitans sp. GAS493 TaxID=1907575 RepID=UPI000BB71096|nr:class I SAM-dependent methyltransferase [Jatrophihabitans sp. GAS493]SOD73001.1 methyltransferase family protein [Jatrophihabitans sp. GAS493]
MEESDQAPAQAANGIDWNGPVARFWADHDDRFDALLARHGEALLAAAAPGPGEQVLDIGCGCGSTTLRAAQAVTPGAGTALGVDISAAMIGQARSRGADAGRANVRFEVADVQTMDFGGASFDLAISRYGVMFFADHTAAFANVRAAMRPNGRLAFVCWAERARNENWTVAFDALAPHLGSPAPVARPSGPFALADPEYVRTLLSRAGWRGIEISQLNEPLRVGSDADDALAFELSDPSTASELAEADPAAAARARADLRAAFAARQRPDGVWLAAASWLVTAFAN